VRQLLIERGEEVFSKLLLLEAEAREGDEEEMNGSTVTGISTQIGGEGEV
jgi:hypothetical protein